MDLHTITEYADQHRGGVRLFIRHDNEAYEEYTLLKKGRDLYEMREKHIDQDGNVDHAARDFDTVEEAIEHAGGLKLTEGQIEPAGGFSLEIDP